MRQNKGFTLFEVIAVLTIIAFFYSLVLQGVGESYRRFMERTDLQQITSDLELLRTASMVRQGHSLCAVFFPVASDNERGREQGRYQLDLGFKVISRNLKGLKLAGEEEAYIFFTDPSIDDSEQANAGLARTGNEKFSAEGSQTSENENKQEVHFIGTSGRNYQIFVLSDGDIEVSIE